MIHKFSLVAEFEYDDENGEYPPYTPDKMLRELFGAMWVKQQHLGLKDVHKEMAKGTLEEAFKIEKL
jgi:hypothetical protein